MLRFLTKKQENKSYAITEFNNILAFASNLLESEHPKRIFDLVYSLGKPYQFEIVNMCIKGKPIITDNAFSFEHIFFKNSSKHYRLTKENTSGLLINYSSSSEQNIMHPSDSLILTFPWNKNRLIDSFQNVGEKVGNKWKHDKLNHRIVHILPLNIGYIINGNHSTVMNVINNEAPLIITDELNLAPVYDEIYTDGRFFRRKLDKSIIDKVRSVEFAAIFEIGRLINLKRLSLYESLIKIV